MNQYTRRSSDLLDEGGKGIAIACVLSLVGWSLVGLAIWWFS